MATKNVKLGVYKTREQIELPAYQTKESACMDIAYSPFGKTHINIFGPTNNPLTRPLDMNSGKVTIMPEERVMIPTGLIFDIPEGYTMRLHMRSSIAYKQGLMLVNGEGVIDSDYTDELYVLAYNTSNRKIELMPGQRIAQAELVEVLNVDMEQLKEPPKPKGNRKGGIGSTGE